jgi:hypothetical protein
MVTRIDLRVHTTAPGSKKDDERFKAQADSYHSSVAGNTFTRIPSSAPPAAQDVPPSLRQPDIIPTYMIPELRKTPEQQITERTEATYDPTTFLEETQLGYTALESQLLAPSSRVSTKALKQIVGPLKDNISALCKPGNEPSDSDEPLPEDSLPSDQVPSQSSYLKSPILDGSNKRPRINDENLHLFQTRFKPLLSSSVASREVDRHAVGNIRNSARHERVSSQSQRCASNLVDSSIFVDDVTSELPTSYSLSDTTSVSSKGGQHRVQQLVSDLGSSPERAAESVVAKAENVQPKTVDPLPGQASHYSEDAVRVSAPTRPVSDKASHRSSKSGIAVKDLGHTADAHQEIGGDIHGSQDYSDLPTSIRAPAPQPSLQPFETHVTESLRYLCENTNLAQCYKPVFVSRDLRVLERGCWTFDIALWPAQVRIEFFQFLAKMIESGRVGWGIWCIREPVAPEVRVFCWGEVVQHVYLMLYVASKSKVRKLGMKWVDAEGEVVVQMRGPDNESRKLST